MSTPIPLQLYSIVIPARDEVESLPGTLDSIHRTMLANNVPHEIVVVDDGSTDGTWELLQKLREQIPTLAPVQNVGLHGFGRAVICGIEASRGDAVVIMMADASDSPQDAVHYWELLNEGYDCAFGSRFMQGSIVIDYPKVKLFLNRIANFLVRVGFRISLNDTTNAFKAYRRTTLEGCRPFLAPHFNLTVELPLKAIVRGYSFSTIPISWTNRRYGTAKLKIKEMGSRYFFICAYVWLEKYFSRGDYHRR
ncbi:MAG: glycosyltransferase family 2 protein [Opitutus sp.]|nr:glycosyltransferase family 2 protein [Opitutus sp.]